MKLANPASWITRDYLRRQAENPELTDAQVLQLHGCVWAESSVDVDCSGRVGGVRRPRIRARRERVVLGFDGSLPAATRQRWSRRQ